MNRQYENSGEESRHFRQKCHLHLCCEDNPLPAEYNMVYFKLSKSQSVYTNVAKVEDAADARREAAVVYADPLTMSRLVGISSR
jgi:hypothetical protein